MLRSTFLCFLFPSSSRFVCAFRLCSAACCSPACSPAAVAAAAVAASSAASVAVAFAFPPIKPTAASPCPRTFQWMMTNQLPSPSSPNRTIYLLAETNDTPTSPPHAPVTFIFYTNCSTYCKVGVYCYLHCTCVGHSCQSVGLGKYLCYGLM